MPYAAPMVSEDEELKKKQQGGAVNISGASTSFDTNVPGQDASTSAAPKQKSSGQYTNIQSYLDANKSQGDAMGQKITDDVSSKASDAENKINTYQSQEIKTDMYDPNEAINRATELNDEEKNRYKTVKQTGGYTGPQTVDQAAGYKEANQAATQASQKVKNAGNEFGQQQLLKENYNRPQYSAGENRLDQVLLQNSAGSKANLEGLSQRYSGLDKALGTANETVGNSINQATAQAQANKQAFTPAEEQARKALLTPLQKRAEEANLNNPALIKRVEEDAADEVLSEETLALLGLSEGQKIYDMDLRSYLNRNQNQVGINNVANADERKRYAALQSLFDDQSMNQVTADGQEIKPIGFNKEQFDKDFAGKDAAGMKARNEFNINAAPVFEGAFGAYNNPFTKANLDYDDYTKIADAADKFYSKYGESGKWTGGTQAEWQDWYNGYTNLAKISMDAGLANSNAVGGGGGDVFLSVLGQARKQYNEANRNYGINRQIKKGTVA